MEPVPRSARVRDFKRSSNEKQIVLGLSDHFYCESAGVLTVDQFFGEVVDNQGCFQKKREKWTRNGPEMVPEGG